MGAATCWPILEAPVDGSISCTDSNYGGSVCVFDCDEGYIMEGNDESECFQFDEFRANWTNNVPTCIPNYSKLFVLLFLLPYPIAAGMTLFIYLY